MRGRELLAATLKRPPLWQSTVVPVVLITRRLAGSCSGRCRRTHGISRTKRGNSPQSCQLACYRYVLSRLGGGGQGRNTAARSRIRRYWNTAALMHTMLLKQSHSSIVTLQSFLIFRQCVHFTGADPLWMKTQTLRPFLFPSCPCPCPSHSDWERFVLHPLLSRVRPGKTKKSK